MDRIALRQIIDWRSHTYTYFVWHKPSKEAFIVDPVLEHEERDFKLVQELGLNVKMLFDTHVHADHKTGAFALKLKLRAKHALGSHSEVTHTDLLCGDGDSLPFDYIDLESRLTPGHTKGCVSFVLKAGTKQWVFTGDTLLIRGCGRTDFQGGDSSTLYHSIQNKLFSLDDETVVYPGHDYKGQTQSTIGEEKRFNLRLKTGTTENQFIDIMKHLKLKEPQNLSEHVDFNSKQ